MSENLYALELSALNQVAGAIAMRVAVEAEIARAHATATEKAEREIARARKLNAHARQTEFATQDESFASASAEISHRFDGDLDASHRSRESKTAQVAERFRTAEKKAKAEYQDQLWTVDSVLEGGEKQAREQQESLNRKAKSGLAHVEGFWKEADPLLARVKVTRSEVAYTGELGRPDDNDPISRLQKSVDASEAAVEHLRKLPLPTLANPAGLIACVVGGLLFVAICTFPFLDPITAAGTTLVFGSSIGLGSYLLIKMLAKQQTIAAGKAIAEKLAETTRASQLLIEYAASEHASAQAKLVDRHARKRRETELYYKPLFEAQQRQLDAESSKIDTEYEAIAGPLKQSREVAARAADSTYRAKRSTTEIRLEDELHAAEKSYREQIAAADAARDARWQQLFTEWRAKTEAAGEIYRRLRNEGAGLFPGWEMIDDSVPLPNKIPGGIRFAEMLSDIRSFPNGLPEDRRLLPATTLVGTMPAFLPFPDRCSVVIKARDERRSVAVSGLQAMMLRFLTGLPPGKVRFTVIDPVGLGENFAAFMHLADYDEKLITSQIWSEPAHIEKQLANLTDHIGSVIQNYLRNQYKSIAEYNEAAGEVAEPYRVLVIANFPTGFTPEAAKRLVSIVNSGPACGVCTLASVDIAAALPRDFNMADLEQPSYVMYWKDQRFTPKDAFLAQFPLALDRPPDAATVARLVRRVGKAAKSTARVEVPFDFIAPKPDSVWRGDASKGFDIAVGRAGATRQQIFTLGRGTAQHALIAGKTGSGKSTLLHAIITNLALTYSPDEAELYLVDFKEGVEFRPYAVHRLPHARVVAIESEREFGLSVLQRLVGILGERGERFRDAGVNDLAGYRAERPNERTPRILLVVDEFQQFFVEDDKASQEAALLLDRLVRQGRAFGVHVLLGSQTLGGAYSLARSTIDQMAVRVALQCSEADAQLILSKDNAAARLLSRPGEAIYNDQNGLVEGNNPFQVVWLSDERREQALAELEARAGGKYPAPLVFEGNASANPADNTHLAASLSAHERPHGKLPAAWLGDPVAIKEPTVAGFRPAGASNLLIVGQNEEAARGLIASALIGLAAQVTSSVPSSVEGERVSPFTLLDGTPDDSDDAEYLRTLAGKLPHRPRAPHRADLPAALAEIVGEIEKRQHGAMGRGTRFLIVFGIQRFRELRKTEDDYPFGRRGEAREVPPSERLLAILRDGPPVGIHAIVWCDSLVNLSRSFDRPALREFALRVLFQMSPTDSSSLMDSPAASRLGRNRALYLTEESDRPEKFRPYGLPEAAWLDWAIARLKSLDAES